MLPANLCRISDSSLFHRYLGRTIALTMALALLAGTSIASSGKDQATMADSPESSLPSLSYGFKGGVSFAQHYGTEERDAEYEVNSEWRVTYAVGGFLIYPITDRFWLQQEVMYVRKGSRQKIGVDILEIPTILDVTYDMDYIEIPVLLKFTWLNRPRFAIRSQSGFALSLRVDDHYILEGTVDDGTEVVPLSADSDMSEVDGFDYSFLYGAEVEFKMMNTRFVLEHRFTIGWNTLLVPTYAYVPFGDEELLIDNEPVPLKTQNHLLLLGVRF